MTKVLMNRMRKAGVDMSDIEEEDHYSKYNLWNENIVPVVEMNTDIDEKLILNNLSNRWLTIKIKCFARNLEQKSANFLRPHVNIVVADNNDDKYDSDPKYNGGLGKYDGGLGK
ncbi:hypothetical protein SNEBB_010819 [Seison nebaliae]|nr:hypothetical protein SNEBB_010819 [Seison nebaliae]